MANRSVRDVLSDLNTIRKGKMPDGSTAGAREKKKRKPVTLGEADVTETQRKPDVNLPDESKGVNDEARTKEHNERKRYIGKRSYKPVTLGGGY